DRDGVLAGPNIEATARLAVSTAIPVIASGGVSSLDDLLAIQANGTIEGAISGRALYDGRINLEEALSLLREHAS
ncbi:MAG: HisA/HisF-related TIM barrel protein, partial [Pseudomonadota bacterium]|nr:HisA/HisF-related TIM barrel protein [Pseudomonadota bacterium]